MIAIAIKDGWSPNIFKLLPLDTHISVPPAVNDQSFDQNNFDVSNIFYDIPRRDWILAPILISKHYSMMIATGASGKSSVAITMALALVTGRFDILQMSVDRPCKVVIINGEDGEEELARRIRANCQYFEIELTELIGRLTVIGARQIQGLTFNKAVPGGGVIADEVGIAKLDAIVRDTGADVVIIDPLGSFLPGGTNDGASASAVAGRLTEICVSRDCALLLVHHVSKAASRDGDNDPTAALGSNHARAIWNIRRPTPAEVSQMGFPPDASKDLLILLHSKANLSRAEDDVIIEMVSVELPNASPPRYMLGDKVGVARRVMPRPMSDLYSSAMLKAVFTRIALGTTAGLIYKASGRPGAQNYVPDISEILKADFADAPIKTRDSMAKSLINQLLSDGRLRKSTAKKSEGGRRQGWRQRS